MTFRREIGAAVSALSLLTVALVVELGFSYWLASEFRVQPAWRPFIGVLLIEIALTAIVAGLGEYASGLNPVSSKPDQTLAAFALASGSLVPLGASLALVLASKSPPTSSELFYIVYSVDPENWDLNYRRVLSGGFFLAFCVCIGSAFASRARRDGGVVMENLVWFFAVAMLAFSGMTLRPWGEVPRQSNISIETSTPYILSFAVWLAGVAVLAFAARNAGKWFTSFFTSVPDVSPFLTFVRRACAVAVGALLALALLKGLLPIVGRVIRATHSDEHEATDLDSLVFDSIPDHVGLLVLRAAVYVGIIALLVAIIYWAKPHVIWVWRFCRRAFGTLVIAVAEIIQRSGISKFWHAVLLGAVGFFSLLVAVNAAVGAARLAGGAFSHLSQIVSEYRFGSKPSQIAVAKFEPSILVCSIVRGVSADDGPNWAYGQETSISLPISSCYLGNQGRVAAIVVFGVASSQGGKQSQAVLSLRRGLQLFTQLRKSRNSDEYVPGAVVVLGRPLGKENGRSLTQVELTAPRPIMGYVLAVSDGNYRFDRSKFVSDLRDKIMRDGISKRYELCQITLVDQSSPGHQRSSIYSCR